MAAQLNLLPFPKRGGRHVFSKRAIFLGGSKLGSDYHLINPSLSFNSQLRGNLKISSANENSLIKERHDVSSVTFKGSIELTDSSPDELDKDRLIEKLNERDNHNGLQNLFAMPHPANPMRMTDVISDHHLFTIDAVTAEYESRQVEPIPVLVAAVETPECIQARFRTYDEYEKLDIAFSRLLVEYLVSPDFRDKVKHRFSHVIGFEFLPGQIYFMMILDACNASVIAC
jgi:hypothetical protein